RFLALALKFRGEWDQAEALNRRNYEVCVRTQGADGYLRFFMTKDLAGILQERGRLDEAKALLRECLDNGRKILGPEHFEVQGVLSGLAEILDAQGTFAEEESLLRELVTICRKRTLEPGDVGANFPTWLRVTPLKDLGALLTRLNRASEAEPLLAEAMTILNSAATPPRNTLRAMVSGWLGACLAAQKRYSQAEPLLLRAYDFLKDVKEGPASLRGGPPSSLAQCVDHLSGLYEAWGKPEAAAMWRARRLDLDFPAEAFAR